MSAVRIRHRLPDKSTTWLFRLTIAPRIRSAHAEKSDGMGQGLLRARAPCVTSHWRRGVPSNMQTGSIRMKIFAAAAVLALLAGPAYAQSQSVPRYGDTDKKKSPQEIEAEREAERAYKRSLGNIPDQGPTTDPWGNVRSDSAPKAAAKA